MPDLPLAGPSAFVTLSDVSAEPNANNDGIIFKVTTDQSVQLRFRIWDALNPSVVIVANEAGAKAGPRQLVAPLATLTADATGDVLGYEILSTTAPPPTLRPFSGTVRMAGARTVAKGNAVPVRFNGFSGSFSAAVPALGVGGNWSRYTWSQWNPKSIA